MIVDTRGATVAKDDQPIIDMIHNQHRKVIMKHQRLTIEIEISAFVADTVGDGVDMYSALIESVRKLVRTEVSALANNNAELQSANVTVLGFFEST